MVIFPEGGFCFVIHVKGSVSARKTKNYPAVSIIFTRMRLIVWMKGFT
jgi:hypothetical protein